MIYPLWPALSAPWSRDLFRVAIMICDPQKVITSDPQNGLLVLTRKKLVVITVFAGAPPSSREHSCDHRAGPRVAFFSVQIPCDNLYGEKPRERNSGENFCRHGRKMWRNFGKKLRRCSSFNFQEKWPREVSRKIGDKFG